MSLHLYSLSKSRGKAVLEERAAFYERMVLAALAAWVDRWVTSNVFDKGPIDDLSKPLLRRSFQVDAYDARSVAERDQFLEKFHARLQP